MPINETITFKRLKQPELTESFNKSRSLLLLGPRQTGKTTLLKEVMESKDGASVLTYHFQLPSTRQRIEADPEVLIREVEAVTQASKNKRHSVRVWIDEIQLVPAVMDVLQFLIDQKKIILAASGSSVRKLRRMGTNWLPGRIQLMHLSPLTWEEAQEGRPRLELDDMLLFGGLPGVLSLKTAQDRSEALHSYEQLYLEEEIRREAASRDLPRFARFLKLAALESGTSPNFSKIGTQVELSHTAIRSHYEILEDSLIVHRLEAFGTSRDQTLRSPRYYFFDLGVRNAAAGIGHSPGILTLQRGVLFEHWVVLEAIARLQDRARFCYWRTKQGDEVDLIIEKDGKRVAIEIKATERPNEKDFAGLASFKKKHDCNEAWVVCRAPRAQRFGPFTAVPFQELGIRLRAI